MLEMLWSGLLTCLAPINVLALIVSVALGIVVGALPGFGAAIGMIIILPLTYTMDHSTALIALSGVYVGCEYGGSISSILLNTPGTSAAMVTAFDGYPMARKGKARDALLISNIASFSGGIMSALSMLLFMPLLAPFVIRFGAAELFLLAAVGLFLVGSISSRDPLKGIISAALGVFTTCIGVDAYVGNPRFTFGSIDLMGGIPFIPVMLGTFSLPSMLALVLTPACTVQEQIVFEKVRFRDNFSAFFRLFRLLFSKMKMLLVRSGLIGVGVGIVPGVGASVATMLAYSSAKRASREPEEFGKGAVEGIVASECSNNGLVGGAFIPVLALGIPGSPAAAVFMAAIFMHGMAPGPNFLANQGPVVYMVIVALFLCALVQMLLGLFTIGSLANILRIPSDKLFPGVIVICAIGAYVVRGLNLDIWIFVLFGLATYFLVRLGFNPGAYALGVILGPIVERSMLEALSLARAKGALVYFMNRPVAQAMLVLIALYVVYRLYRRVRRGPAPEKNIATGEIPGLLEGMRGADFLSALIALPVIAGFASLLGDYPPKTAMFPAIVLGLLAILMTAIILKAVLMPVRYASMTEAPFSCINWKGIGMHAALLIAYVLGIKHIGFYVSSAMLIFVLCSLLKKDGLSSKNVLWNAIFTLIFVAVCYVIFSLGFGVATPRGLLF